MDFFIPIFFFLLLFYVYFYPFSLCKSIGGYAAQDVVSKIPENKHLAQFVYDFHWAFLGIIFCFAVVIYLDLLFYGGLKKPESLYEDTFLANHRRNFESLQHLREVESIRKIRLKISLVSSIWFIGLLLWCWLSLFAI